MLSKTRDYTAQFLQQKLLEGNFEITINSANAKQEIRVSNNDNTGKLEFDINKPYIQSSRGGKVQQKVYPITKELYDGLDGKYWNIGEPKGKRKQRNFSERSTQKVPTKRIKAEPSYEDHKRSKIEFTPKNIIGRRFNHELLRIEWMVDWGNDEITWELKESFVFEDKGKLKSVNNLWETFEKNHPYTKSWPLDYKKKKTCSYSNSK